MTNSAYVVIGESTTLSNLGDVILYDNWVEGVFFDYEKAAVYADMLTTIVEISTLPNGCVDFKRIVDCDSRAKFHNPINWYPSMVSYKIQAAEVFD